ncbi:MAG: DNA-processing protein DprA [Pseudomonadota bacterium]
MAKEFSPSPPPLTPPLNEEVKLSWLRLLRSRRVGVATFHRLLGEYGSAEAALNALPEIARAAGVAEYRACTAQTAERELAAGHRAGARLLALGDVDYPQGLAALADAPPLLWAKGRTELLSRPLLALVGARNASSLGTRMARKIAAELADAGRVVVSGLARGIDTAAHLGCLEGGTIAVFAGGVDVVYPAENAVLAQEIAEKGLCLSEAPMHLQPQARHFPARNRIVSGLSEAVIVVEAAAKSGSLITARTALDQGRDVLAVPGHPFDARAAGCNLLIRDGARLVRGADDILDAVSAPAATVPRPAPAAVPEKAPETAPGTRTLAETARLHSEILDRLGPSPVAEDQLIRDLSRPAGEVAPALVSLELDGAIQRQPGGLLSRLR